MRSILSAGRLGLAAALTLVMALAACAVTPGQERDRRMAADGAACPDVQRPLPFPVTRPECWTDEEWDQYLTREAERARNGDRYNEWSYF
jgi:hypothetical protein